MRSISSLLIGTGSTVRRFPTTFGIPKASNQSHVHIRPAIGLFTVPQTIQFKRLSQHYTEPEDPYGDPRDPYAPESVRRPNDFKNDISDDQNQEDTHLSPLIAPIDAWLEESHYWDADDVDPKRPRTIHPQFSYTHADSIDDVDIIDRNKRSIIPDRTPGKYEFIKELLTRSKAAPRAALQKQLVANGIDPQSARRYAQLLEERGMDTYEKTNMLMRRMQRKYPPIN